MGISLIMNVDDVSNKDGKNSKCTVFAIVERKLSVGSPLSHYKYRINEWVSSINSLDVQRDAVRKDAHIDDNNNSSNRTSIKIG